MHSNRDVTKLLGDSAPPLWLERWKGQEGLSSGWQSCHEGDYLQVMGRQGGLEALLEVTLGSPHRLSWRRQGSSKVTVSP